MKILHVEGGRNLYGGALQVLYLVEGLKIRGVENLLACRGGCALALAAAPFAEVHGMHMAGDLDVLLIPRLYRLILAAKPDLVHIHSRIGADVMGGIAARLAGVPIVHSRRQDNPENRWVVALKYRLHDRVVAISEGIGRVLLSEGLPPEKLRCVRSAVKAQPFQQPRDEAWFRAEFRLPEGSLVMGIVAQLIPRKGHRFLLQAMPELRRQFPELHLILFGQGSAEAGIRESIRALGLESCVQLAGFRDDLPRILPCLDLLAHPALMEGLGVSLLQAASVGIPIVASRAGGIPEAVRDGINGLLVQPGNSEDLGRAVARVLGDRELALRLGESGRELVAREFSVDCMVEGNLRVYRELLSACGR